MNDKKAHYYIHSNWSIIQTADPIAEEDIRGWSESAQPAHGFRDDEVRYQLTAEEVAEYQREPIKFVFENELATFRDGKVVECEPEEIINGSKEICSICTLCHVLEGDGSCCGCLEIQRDEGRYEELWGEDEADDDESDDPIQPTPEWQNDAGEPLYNPIEGWRADDDARD